MYFSKNYEKLFLLVPKVFVDEMTAAQVFYAEYPCAAAILAAKAFGTDKICSVF